jgi:general nucleoside transport system permease protein
LSLRIILLIAGGLAVVVALLMSTGVVPMEAVRGLIQGSLGSPAALSGTLRETTPLLIAGLAVFLALRAGLFNIGVEGQFLVGAAACAFTAIQAPGIGGLLLGAAVGVVAGALWAFPAGWIRAYRGGHEVITTIMLNYIAFHITTMLVAGPFKDPAQEGTTTVVLDQAARLPWLVQRPPLQINFALLIGVILVFLLATWLRRSIAGYELRATGANPTAAAVAGVDTRKVTVSAMLWSGALAGLAGAFQVLAYEGRFYAGFSAGYGFDALGVAILAGPSAVGVLPASFLFGILSKGGTSIQILGVPKGITAVIVGLLIIIFAAVRYRRSSVGG